MVNLFNYVKKSDAMNTREINPTIRSNSIDTFETAQAVPDTQFEYVWQIFDGINSAAWTVSSVNASQGGLRDVT